MDHTHDIKTRNVEGCDINVELNVIMVKHKMQLLATKSLLHEC